MQKGESKLSLGDHKGGMSPPFAFSPDSKLVIANHRDRRVNKGSVVMWEVGTGKIVRTFATRSQYANQAAFGRGGKQVVIVDDGGYMRRFDTVTGKQLWSVLVPERGAPGVVAFSKDAGLAAIDTRGNGRSFLDMRLDLWDALKGEHLDTLLPHYR
jgi:WD40 repeat protein